MGKHRAELVTFTMRLEPDLAALVARAVELSSLTRAAWIRGKLKAAALRAVRKSTGESVL